MSEDKNNKKPYEKPKIIYRKELEVKAIVCDSAWLPGVQCQLIGDAACIRTRT